MPVRDVVILLYDGLAALDAVGPADVFATANEIAGSTAYRLHYVGRSVAAQASNGMTFATQPIGETAPVRPHTLFVPGGDEGPLNAVMACDATMTWLGESARRAVRVCSVCSGAFVLAALGLLEGRRATTHWRGLAWLERVPRAPTVDAQALFVEDGRIWTSAGVTAGIDMALALVERDLGREIALGVARELVLFLIRPGGQAQFAGPLDLQARAIASDLRALPAWLEAHLTERTSVADMAAAMAMSERTFHRRCLAVFGETPLALLQRRRLDRARALLEDAGVPLKTVAAQSGFGDAATLRRIFQQTFGVTPGNYRRSFGGGITSRPSANTLQTG